jgi:uracil-DNA glycosylase
MEEGSVFMNKIKLNQQWLELLSSHLKRQEFINLISEINQEYLDGERTYPQPDKIFNALNLTSPGEVKIVILGQDPYHGPGQAMGLSFSVPAELKNPPSLKNIFKELESELGHKSEAELKFNGDLTTWAKQGVLLLNSVLTVKAGKPGSHSRRGWEQFTDGIISELSNNYSGIIFMLWGNYAKQKLSLIDLDKHTVLTAPHPSPFSAHSGFFGCNHFIEANRQLEANGKDEIKW